MKVKTWDEIIGQIFSKDLILTSTTEDLRKTLEDDLNDEGEVVKTVDEKMTEMLNDLSRSMTVADGVAIMELFEIKEGFTRMKFAQLQELIEIPLEVFLISESKVFALFNVISKIFKKVKILSDEEYNLEMISIKDSLYISRQFSALLNKRMQDLKKK